MEWHFNVILKIISLFFYLSSAFRQTINLRGLFLPAEEQGFKAGTYQMLAGGQSTDGVRKVRALRFAAQGGQPPRCHKPKEPQGALLQVWCGGTDSRQKMEWEHLLLLANAQRHSKAALAGSFFFPYAKDLLLGVGSSLCISSTLKFSNSVLKYIWPIADLSQSWEQPFLLADADAGNS